ncbi:MAG TPA: lauroyl acyltransferase [Gammaproteobacteria bacterium]|nr:lauroyl acyltransferase [Gammaproteobacteria bacterium]
MADTRYPPRPHRRRRRLARLIVWPAEAMFLLLFWRLAACLSPARASAAGAWLFGRIGPHLGKQRFVAGNLALAFPDRSQARRDALARQVWANFGAVLAEYAHLRRLSAHQRRQRLELHVDPRARAVLQAARPAIYVSAHMANWELAAAAITAAGVPLSVVYAPQGNPLVNRLLQARRRVMGCRFIPKQQALRRLLRELRDGRSIGILPDQRVDAGRPLPFFGHRAQTTTSPALLALRTGLPLIPVQIERMGHARYRATFHAPLRVGEAADAEAITLRLNSLFEDWIRRRPEQWLCMRRRWPPATYRLVAES